MATERSTSFSLKKKLIRWLEDNRGIVIFLFCLPASFIFDLVLELRLWFKNRFFSAPWQHDKRVQDIQSKVQLWNKLPLKERKPLCTSRPNWLSLSVTFTKKVGNRIENFIIVHSSPFTGPMSQSTNRFV